MSSRIVLGLLLVLVSIVSIPSALATVTYELRAEKEGVGAVVQDLKLTPQETNRLTFTLAPVAKPPAK